MNDELIIKQHNAISRASYNMPATLRKIIFVVMALTELNKDKIKEVELTLADLVDYLDLSRGGNTYKILEDSIESAMKQIITLDTGDGWVKFQWLSKAKHIKSRDVYKFKLHEDLKDYVLNLKKDFALWAIPRIGQLQGKYAIHIFELVMSMSGKSGKDGNEEGCWYYEIYITDLRKKFEIGKKEYARTSNLRTRVIDNPVEEINQAQIGIHITPKYIYKRRHLDSVIFNVKRIKKGDMKIVNPVTKTEVEDSNFVDKHEERFNQILEDLMKQQELPFSSGNTYTRNSILRKEAIDTLRKELQS